MRRWLRWRLPRGQGIAAAAARVGTNRPLDSPLCQLCGLWPARPRRAGGARAATRAAETHGTIAQHPAFSGAGAPLGAALRARRRPTWHFEVATLEATAACQRLLARRWAQAVPALLRRATHRVARRAPAQRGSSTQREPRGGRLAGRPARRAPACVRATRPSRLGGAVSQVAPPRSALPHLTAPGGAAGGTGSPLAREGTRAGV